MKFVNAFQKVGLTIAAIVFAFAALFYSISPAQADAPASVNQTGKYMMHQNSLVKPNGDWYWHVLVWNTETGKSKMYYFNRKDNTIQKANYQLPTSPIY